MKKSKTYCGRALDRYQFVQSKSDVNESHDPYTPSPEEMKRMARALQMAEDALTLHILQGTPDHPDQKPRGILRTEKVVKGERLE